MTILVLADVKEHLRVYHGDEDDLIVAKMDAAEAHLESLLGYSITEEFETVPADIKEAIMTLVGHWFENREATNSGGFEDTPFTVWDVVRERRSYAFE
uniref:head-tail connector protein n=1 Tax=uncultured Rhizobium sp. TaxID=155567 RepID=UPI00262E2B81|nr:head-tail connector protein [uncultured Rhizobium sp.]